MSALCFNLNKYAVETVWFQNLGEGGDPYPVLDSTHGVVYRTGKILCDGSDTEETIYSNTPGELSQPEHNYVNGICTQCNGYAPDQVVDGVYQISSAQQLMWFADYVNAGNTSAQAALTADIDMTGIEGFMPIGLYHDAVADADLPNYNMQFTGTFDGQMHVIKNLTIATDGYYEAGLFSRIYKATVKNLGIENADITTNAATGRIGAIVGLNREGSIENCWSAGILNFVSTSSETAFGGLAGNTNNTNGKFVNCWSTFVGPLTTGSGTLANCYSYATDENIVADARSGQLCYTLNNGDFIHPQWFQNVGEDDYPSWDATKGIVYPTTDGYESFDPHDNDSYGIFRDHLMDVETKFVEETKAYKALLDEYQLKVDAWENILTFEAFCSNYVAMESMREEIRVSEAGYKAYMEACEYAITYLDENRFKSAMRTFLEGYLEKDEAPGEDYAHGTYQYILRMLQLNNEEIVAETEYVNELLQQTIATNIVPGTEITVTMTNVDFKAGLDGWSVETEGATVAVGGEASLMSVVTAKGTPFTLSQTLTDIPNGIYIMTANGISRAGTDNTSTYHSAQLFMNGNQNYLMAPSEDMVTKDDAVDGVNCYLTGDGADSEYLYEDAEGYVPGSATGASYAFAAGRYPSSIAVEVTDSMLQVGVRNLGTGLSDDWTAFANVHVYYLGSAEQASEKLTDVLACCMTRAQALLDFPWTDSEEYYMYPNMSEDLKSALETYIAQGAAATSGEEQMAVINALSATMDEAYVCRRAYISMAEMAEALIDKAQTLLDNHLIDEDLFNQKHAQNTLYTP